MRYIVRVSDFGGYDVIDTVTNQRMTHSEDYEGAQQTADDLEVTHSAENDVCGGCRGIGSHRRHCPRHPDYHPWKRLADMAESIGDQVGEPSLANRAWALAGAIREAIPTRPIPPGTGEADGKEK